MSTEEGHKEGEVSGEAMSTGGIEMPIQPNEQTQAQAVEPSAAPASPNVGGRRTQLKVMRERVQTLTKEVGEFRKSHEVSKKKLEGDLASLRNDLTKVRSKDLAGHLKGHGADTKRLEKEVASLRRELASVKTKMAKEAAKSKAREDALLKRVISKVKTAKPSSKTRAKHSKRHR